MGCDIHAYIEYKKPDDAEWRSFGYDIFHLTRNYDMFAVMAGVRNYGDLKPVVKPRGLPEDIAWQAKRGNSVYIEKNSLYINEDEGNNISEETAKNWIEKGYSTKVDEHHVTNPDWHTHSWLTLNEIKKCVKKIKQVDITYDCLVACMETIEKKEFITRLVFWFDN